VTEAALAIDARGLVRRFGTAVAVDGVDLAVLAGEIFGFLGPNGAGKTTTIKMLCTLLAPTSGTARLAGHDVVSDAASVRRAIGVIFQDPSLDERLTADENMHLHAVAYHVLRSERAARITDALTYVDLVDRRAEIVRTWSGGMKRRLEIARGLVHRPQILFLDEPTTGLDPQTRARTWEVLRSLRADWGVTLFLTTHYMEEAENCDRIAIIDHGRIVALDTPEALKRQVGRDVVTVRTPEVAAVERWLRDAHGLDPRVTEGGLEFTAEDGEALVVRLLSEVGRPRLDAVGVRRPTLDDVFLAMTGRSIRAEGAPASARIARVGGRR
jgi:ABC-2 type transport system ATP-binding protein